MGPAENCAVVFNGLVEDYLCLRWIARCGYSTIYLIVPLRAYCDAVLKRVEELRLQTFVVDLDNYVVAKNCLRYLYERYGIGVIAVSASCLTSVLERVCRELGIVLRVLSTPCYIPWSRVATRTMV
ncbi:MAG: hypothetical protein DRJ40_10355 [Thermoprotei archaeon]|nr:MAG: hypothetical protein DRJ40_10355 [Thermoprotei archaeon]